MTKKIRYFPLRTKLYLLICFIILIALGTISYRYVTRTKSLLETQMTQRSLSLAEISVKSLENYFLFWQQQGSQVLRSLSKKKPSDAQIFASGILETNDDLSFLHIFRNLQGSISEVMLIGDIKSSKPFLENYKKWALQIKKDSMEQAYLLSLASIDNRHYGMCFPALADDQSILWACLTIKKNGLFDFLSSEQNIVSFLLNKNGDFILSQKKDFSKLKIFKNAVSGNVSVGSSFFPWKDKQTYLGAYAWSEKFKFSVVYIKDIQESQKSIRSELLKIGILTLVILIISLFIGYYSAVSMTSKLNQLTELTNTIASGNFSHRIALKSNDEIGFLQNSINRMAGEINRLLHFSVEAAKKEKELLTAKAVQDTFFQKDFIQSDNLSTFGTYISADECGGDWWGHFKISERFDLICIADATGHGAPAAIVTAMAYSFFQTFFYLFKKEDRVAIAPGELLKSLNDVFWEAGHGRTTMTFFLGFVDKLEGTFHYANAGHNFPLVFPKDPDDKRIKKRKQKSSLPENYFQIGQKGQPLGYMEGTTFSSDIINLENGDKIFMYTDGLIECKNSENSMWGKRNLIKALTDLIHQKIDYVVPQLVGKAYQFFDKTPIDDDITIVLVEYQ